MAYVSVPKDLTRVKNKVAFNLTRRQIICFGIAGVIGIPFYLFTRNLIGNSNAMMGMVVLMIPSFLFAMYEKDGMPLEKVLMNIITVKYRRPQVRPYETENFYEKDIVMTAGTKKKKHEIAGTRNGAFGAGNYGRSMDGRHVEHNGGVSSPQMKLRNAEAAFHAAEQRGGRKHARQG